MAKRQALFTIYCGDAHHRITFNDRRKPWKLSVLMSKLNFLLRNWEVENFFPGLVVQDEEGQLWKPKLRVDLVAYTPEET